MSSAAVIFTVTSLHLNRQRFSCSRLHTNTYVVSGCQFHGYKPTLKSSAILIFTVITIHLSHHQGRIQRGAHPARAPPPLKLEKMWFFWRKIVIFHTKYPTNVRASLRSAQFFKCAPPLTWNPGSAHDHGYKPTLKSLVIFMLTVTSLLLCRRCFLFSISSLYPSVSLVFVVWFRVVHMLRQ